MLYIVATPIGNLEDITLRALKVLNEVDGIICEDTRRTSILLNNYQIKKPLYVLNDFNENSTYLNLISHLQQGLNLALVSDAGTPLISDPGYKLVRGCIENNLEVDSIPGPSSVITALSASGLPPDKFIFLGYLPEKPGARKQILEKTLEINKLIKATYIIFLSPHKLVKNLEEIIQVIGNRQVVLAKELTKINQSIKSKQVGDWIEDFKRSNPKGEYIMLFNLGD